MKVLITGAQGQLGQDIVNQCTIRGIEHTATNSKTLDITNQKCVNAMVKTHDPDIIFNCAAYNAVDLAEEEWKKAFSVNGLGVKHLALAANKYGSILVHFSTDYVFDGNKNRPYTVVDIPKPINRYGESKLFGENIVRDLCNHYFLIRISWLFGKGNTNFVSKVLDWSREKTEIAIVEDQISSPTYTVDLAKASLDLVSTYSFGLYHITNSGDCPRYDWARYILEKAGWTGKLLNVKSNVFRTPAHRPAYSVLDNFGTHETLGYTLPSWQDATSRYLQEIGVIA
jgi:dTDP-4-dehydrorhamnose reductase